jgi:SAM-dependent methyltransferase
MSSDLYANRLLTEGHPELAARAVQTFIETQVEDDARVETTEWLLSYVSRLRALQAGSAVTVVGCGPKPLTCRQLAGRGFDVTAVEPVPGFAQAAEAYLGGVGRVVIGAAEQMPLPSNSQDLVLCESILEHVESPRLSLSEMYRLLRPGGLVWIVTTNRWRFSVTGYNHEFNIPFYNWLPSLVKEAYIYDHLHFRPSLANYSLRPAVHWFTYAGLCKAGRDVGFSRFYSILDLVSADDPRVKGRRFRQRLLKAIRHRPALRALALTQVGGTVVMVKE